MTLTLGNGPLSARPPDAANYTIDGPQHRLLATPFPRRVRAELAGTTVFDTTEGVLVHETNILPVLYVPETDVATELLEATDHHTHCPFKGDASYWSIRVGDTVAENAVWGYPAPNDEAQWFLGLQAFYWDRLDHWYDETEEVFAHLRDPYHRVDVRPSSRGVRVRIGDTVVAESEHPMVLSENGLPNRYYIPPSDVRMELLSESSTTTHCPYKGQTIYWTFAADGVEVGDVAWSYPETFDEARRITRHLSFDGNDVTVETL